MNHSADKLISDEALKEKIFFMKSILNEKQYRQFLAKSPTPSSTGVGTWPYKGYNLHARRAGVASIRYLLPLKSGSIFFLRFVILLLNVSLDRVFRYVPYCSNIVSSSPKGLVPLVLQFWMPVKYHQGAFPFQVPHELRHTHFRWNAVA